MGTITKRKRADGSSSYTVTIRKFRHGKQVYQESRTFRSRATAKRWERDREQELDEPGAVQRLRGRISVGKAIERYCEELGGIRKFGRTKQSTLTFLADQPIGQQVAGELTVSDLVAHVRKRRRTAGASTVLNDLIWLRVVFKYGRAAWNADLPLLAVEDALTICKSERLVNRPRRRERRLETTEEEALRNYFSERDRRSKIPMLDIFDFAIASARRQAEITRLQWSDNNEADRTGLVRDHKHPREKQGNHRTFAYTPQGWEIAKRQPRTSGFIFPYNPKSVGSAFTNACKILEIDDLRFHDLRHEATGRLFEAGYSIHEVQQFTLHDDWGTLRRYTHLRPADVVRR